MANKRTYNLSDVADLTGSYLPVDKSGNSEALKFPADGLSKFKKVSVSSAELRAGNTSPIELITPIDGNIIIVDKYILDYRFGTTQYATNFDLYFLMNSIELDRLVSLNYANDYTYVFGAVYYDGAYTITDLINQPLFLYIQTGDPTAGDGTLDIYLWYNELTL